MIYLETLLAERFDLPISVICPITDPYVVHHGALGSAVTIHIDPNNEMGAAEDPSNRMIDLDTVRAFVASVPGVTEVCTITAMASPTSACTTAAHRRRTPPHQRQILPVR